jgi:NTE family protein
MRTRVAILIALAAGLLAGPGLAQSERPRIGLVLGGGGARGFAHVGVLQVLEENRIPVHAIAGTSMGAVVGSLYAAGRDADAIEEVAYDIDWTTIFADRIPRDRLSFRRKQDERNDLINFRIAFDDRGVVLPPGVLRGQDLFLTLAEKLAPARGVREFDKLPIPFRAIAANIETGEAVAIGSGDIATAVFASMAVPGGLPPVEREGLLLVDGGIVDNVPIDVARAMGVDILIVVNVGTELRSRDDLRSFVNVLDQMQLLLGRAEVERQIRSLGPRDVLIAPDLDGVSVTSFERAELGIARGRAAAEAARSQLAALALDEAAWAAHLAARQARAPGLPPVITAVRIENDSPIPQRTIEKKISAKAGEPLDAARLTTDLQDVFALGGLRNVRHELSAEDALVISVQDDPTSENFFQFGLSLATDFNTEYRFGISLAHTDRDFFGTGAEWRTDLRIGPEMRFQSTLYREFGRFLAEAGPYWFRRDTILFDDGFPVAVFRTGELGVRADGGLLFGNWGEVRLGLTRSRLRIDQALFEIDSDLLTFEDMAWRIGFTVDTLDNLNFPTRGTSGFVLFEDHVRALGGELDYERLAGRFSWITSRGRTSFILGAEGGTSFDSGTPLIGDFRLGGFLRLSGLAPSELIGRHALIGRAIVYHRLFDRSPIIDIPLYAGGSFELGNAFNDWDDIGLRPAGSLFLSADTPLGPVTLAGGAADGGQSLYFILGRIF